MTQENKTGMWLRKAPDSQTKDASWLIQMIIAMLASSILVLTATELTGNSWMVMLMASVWLCIVYGISVKTQHEGWFYIGVLVLTLVVTLGFREQVLEGFRIFWNTAGDAFVHGTGWVLPEWELQTGVGQHDLCVVLFSILTACPISLLCCALTSFSPIVLAALLPVILAVGMVVFQADAQFAWLLPVLCASVLIFLYSGWRKKASVAPVFLSWAVCAGFAGLLIIGTCLPGVQDWSVQIREYTHDILHKIKYETDYTTLPEGDFTDYQNVDRKAEPALAVTMEKPQQLYLRGFTGAVFTGDTWEPLDAEVLLKNKDLLYWLNLNAFDQHAQFETAAAYAGVAQSTVTIQNIGACSFYRYVPFSIGKGAWTQAENLNTDGVYAEGTRNDVYAVTDGSTEDIMQVLTYLQTSDDPAVLQYRKAESGYRQFVKQYYLQIPEEVKAILQEQWDGIASHYGGVGNLTLQQAQECALIFLGRCYPEEGTSENMTLPLKMAEGTTFQYATVAAMTLRYFGIPARYAEGYVVSKEMAAESEAGQTVTVDSSCAKAWVEVYQDGIGWIPMDLTPGIGEILEDPDKKEPNQEDPSDQDPDDKQESQEPTGQPQEQPDPTGGSMVMIILRTILWSLLIAMGIFLVIFLILWFRRKVILAQKENQFKSENVNDAVVWIYGDVAILLEKLGFDRGNGSMKNLKKPLEEAYGREFATQFEAMTDLNDRAVFSSHRLQEAHRQSLTEFRNQVLQKLKTELKWYKRIWLAWGLCLY